MSFFTKFVIIADIIGFFIITRYPYIDLFCILMRHGSMADLNHQTLNPSAGRLAMTMDAIKQNFEVFVHGAIFFVCATGMTLDIQRRNCGIMAAIHVICSAIFTCFEHRQWSEFMIVKVVARAIASVGAYFFVAGGLTDSTKGRAKVSQFLEIGRKLMSLYLFYLAYMIWINKEDRIALVRHVPGGLIMLVIVVAVYVVCGLAIYGGYEAGYFGKLASWQLIVLTLLTDYDTKFWYKAHDRVDYWTQIQLATRHFAVVAGLLLLGRKRHW